MEKELIELARETNQIICCIVIATANGIQQNVHMAINPEDLKIPSQGALLKKCRLLLGGSEEQRQEAMRLMKERTEKVNELIERYAKPAFINLIEAMLLAQDERGKVQ